MVTIAATETQPEGSVQKKAQSEMPVHAADIAAAPAGAAFKPRYAWSGHV